MSHVTRFSFATRINAGLLTSTAIENPRVDGSIPSQATNMKAQLFSVGPFLLGSWRDSRASGPFCVCYKSVRVSHKSGVRLSLGPTFSKNCGELGARSTRKTSYRSMICARVESAQFCFRFRTAHVK